MTEPRSQENPASPEILLGDLLRQFANRLDAAEQREDGVESDVAGLSQEISTLTSRLADLDERLRTVQRLLTEQRTDLTQERSLTCLALGEEYTTLITQHFTNVAQQLSVSDRPESGLDTAQTIADLCQLLFGDVPLQRHDILRALALNANHPGTPLALQAAASALSLRERANETKDHILWDFAILPGSQVNDRQSPWANCAPDLPVRFVVAPAFVVNGTTIVRQLVYTSAQPTKLRPPAFLGQPRRRKILNSTASRRKDSRRSGKNPPFPGGGRFG